MQSKSGRFVSWLIAATGLFFFAGLAIDARPIGRDLVFVDALIDDGVASTDRTSADQSAAAMIAEAPVVRAIFAAFHRILSPKAAAVASILLTMLGHLAGTLALFSILQRIGHSSLLAALGALLYLAHPGLFDSVATSTAAHGVLLPAFLLVAMHFYDRIRPGEEMTVGAAVLAAVALSAAAATGKAAAFVAPFGFVSFVVVRLVLDGFWSNYGRKTALRRAVPILLPAVAAAAMTAIWARGAGDPQGSASELLRTVFFFRGAGGGATLWPSGFLLMSAALAAACIPATVGGAVFSAVRSPWAKESAEVDSAAVGATFALGVLFAATSAAATFFSADRAVVVGIAVLSATFFFVALAAAPFWFLRTTGRNRAIIQGILGIVVLLAAERIGAGRSAELRADRAEVDRLLTAIARASDGAPNLKTAYLLQRDGTDRGRVRLFGGASSAVLTRAAARLLPPRDIANAIHVRSPAELIADWADIERSPAEAERRTVIVVQKDGAIVHASYVENPWASGASTLRFAVPDRKDVKAVDFAGLEDYVDRDRSVDVPLATIVQWVRSAPDTAATALDRIESLTPTDEIAVFDLLLDPVPSLRRSAARLLKRAWGGQATARIDMVLKAAPTAHAAALVEHLEIIDEAGVRSHIEKIAARADLSGELLHLRSRIGDEPTEEEITAIAKSADVHSSARADMLAAKFDEDARVRLWSRSIDATADMKSRFDAFSALMRADDGLARTALWTFLPTILNEDAFGWAAVEAATPDAPQTSRRLLLFVEPQPRWPMRLRKRAGAFRDANPSAGDHEKIAGAIVELMSATLGGGAVPAEVWTKIAKSADDPEISENLPEAIWVKAALKAVWGGGKVSAKDWRWSFVPRAVAVPGAPFSAVVTIKNTGERPIFGGTAPYALKLVVVFRELTASGEPGSFTEEVVVGLPWTMIDPGETQRLPVTIQAPPSGRAYSLTWRWGETLGSTVADLPGQPSDRLDLR